MQVNSTHQVPKVLPEPREITTVPRISDRIFRGIVTTGGLSTLAILALIAFFLVFNGFEVMRNEGLRFLTGFDWVDAIPEEGLLASYGIGAMLYGTLVIGLLAIILEFRLL